MSDIPTILTPKEKELFEKLIATEDGFLRRHKTMTGNFCFRLLDNKINPISNYKSEVVKSLIEKGWLKLDGDKYFVRAIIKEKMDISKLGLRKD